MAQASAAASRDQPSSNSAIASIRRAAFASCVRAAASRRSAADTSKRVIATVIAVPLRSTRGRRITPRRAAPIHIRVNGPGGWYYLARRLGLEPAIDRPDGGHPCARPRAHQRRRGPRLSHATDRRHFTALFVVVLGTTALLVTILHGVEGAIWAGAYLLLGALPDNRSAILYSLSSITSYGHAGIFLEGQWQLMGALEALNGMMLFGLTTAFLFAMIQKVWPVGRRGWHREH